MGLGDITFFGLAIVYGSLASLVVTGGLWASSVASPWRFFPFLCTTLTFVFLTHHPFPTAGTLTCPVPTAEPQLALFNFAQTIQKMGRWYSTPLDYLTNRTLVASAMNFLICVAIGAALARHMHAWVGIILFSVALTATIELSQLTGVWGYYSCAYRQFNVDDLMLNVLGTLCGAALQKRRKRTT